MFFCKEANASNSLVADRIIDRIYNENPSFWPHGVSRHHFDGGLYLVSKSASMEPVGFVGWQERKEKGRKIGYYSIGVLAEHRNQGFAKSAVTQMLREKAAGVDEVRALIAPHNSPSKALARSIPGITVMEKEAATKKGSGLATLMAVLGGAAAGGPGFDNFTHGANKGFLQTFNEAMADDHRRHQMGWNTALGGAAGLLGAKVGPEAGIAGLLAVPGKDLIMSGNRTLNELRPGKINDALDAAAHPAKSPIDKGMLNVGLGLGAAGLAGGGFAAYKLLKALKERTAAAKGGRVKVTLPTKEPGDAETIIDLPMEDVALSRSLYGRLGRDTRRRLYVETKGRTRRVNPKKKNLSPREQEIVHLQDEAEAIEKTAYQKLAAAAVPSPPPQGVNPALRMTQESMAAQAQSSTASTDANPQIMQAQQAQAQAEQAAQAQVAQAEQAAEAKVMEANQQHAEQAAQADMERMKVQQENEILKMEAKRNKIEGELKSKEHEMTKSISDRENKTVMDMTKRRLNRVRGRFSKVAAASPQAPAAQDRLAPWAGQRLNNNGMELMARGRLMPTHVYRASYGKLGDTAYDWLARKALTTPSASSAVDPYSLPSGVFAGNPDAFGMLLRGASDAMLRPRLQ